MSRIFYILGKSCSGKDTIYKRILKECGDNLSKVVLYTTRPQRSGETEGSEYHFVSEEEFQRFKAEGLVIEDRAYNTVHGLWRYFTILDRQIESEKDLIMIGVLESFISTRDYFGNDKVVPIYIDLDDGIRLKRAVEREMSQKDPKYAELCRRFLSDAEDFSDEKIDKAGIKRRFINDNLDECVTSIKTFMEEMRKG